MTITDPATRNTSLNPLLPMVLQLLRELPLGCSEYELMQQLERAQAFPPVAALADLALFQKHFLLMNALYQLQESLWRDEGIVLTVGPLFIGLAVAAEAIDGTALDDGSSAPLRAYYLDWQQFTQTDSAAVAELLGGFWQRFHADDRKVQALSVLELSEANTWNDIKQQYRRLAARYHPDRGGCGEQFLAVRAAYEVLRLIHGAA